MAISKTDIQISELAEDDRVLYDAGWAELDCYPTPTGWELLKKIVLKQNKAELVELAEKVGASKTTGPEEDND